MKCVLYSEVARKIKVQYAAKLMEEISDDLMLDLIETIESYVDGEILQRDVEDWAKLEVANDYEKLNAVDPIDMDAVIDHINVFPYGEDDPNRIEDERSDALLDVR